MYCMLYIIKYILLDGTDSMISTKTGFGSDTDIIFHKQGSIEYQKSTIRSSLVWCPYWNKKSFRSDYFIICCTVRYCVWLTLSLKRSMVQNFQHAQYYFPFLWLLAIACFLTCRLRSYFQTEKYLVQKVCAKNATNDFEFLAAGLTLPIFKFFWCSIYPVKPFCLDPHLVSQLFYGDDSTAHWAKVVDFSCTCRFRLIMTVGRLICGLSALSTKFPKLQNFVLILHSYHSQEKCKIALA